MADEKKDAAKTTTAPDSAAATQKPRGEVKMEGQIAPQVASPTGPVPVSALVATKEQAKELREARREKIEAERNHPKAGDFLDEETVESLNSAERRAIARQRGYKVEGRRLSAEQFNRLQAEDENLEAPSKSTKAKK